MKVRGILVGTSAAALILSAVATASPASAATGVTLTVVGGALSISVPATADLGTWTNTVSGGTVSAPLGEVQVLDSRSATAGSGWVASVISTAL